MKTINTVRLFYIIYTIYSIFILLVSDYRMCYALTGLACMWGSYLFIKMGYIFGHNFTISRNDRKEKKIEQFPLSNMENWSAIKSFIVLVISWICTLLATRYYTGKSFTSVITGAFGNTSAYYAYQSYFSESNIATFSIAKIPYIFMLAFVSIIMMWSLMGLILGEKKIKWWKYIYLVGVVAAYLYFGIARGTNFETYIVFVLVSYCVLQKMENVNYSKKIKYFAFFVVLMIIMVLVFRTVVMGRGITFSNKLCNEIQFCEDSTFATMFPTLTNIGISIFSYLGYGIYTIGVTIYDISIETIKGSIALMLPRGYEMLFNSTLENILRDTIDLGVRWCPDYIKLIGLLGLPLYVLFLLILGNFMYRIENGQYPKLLKNVILAIVFIQMLSLPVGNFLLNSSSNKLMVIFAIFWLIQYKKIRVRVKK